MGSAWAWALLPNVMFWCTRAVWETSLSALAADDDLLAGADSGRSRRLAALASVRTAVGHHGAEQHFPAVVSAGCRIVGLVSAGATRQAIVGRRCAGVGRFLRVHHAVAGAQLSKHSASSFSFATTSAPNFAWATATAPTER